MFDGRLTSAGMPAGVELDLVSRYCSLHTGSAKDHYLTNSPACVQSMAQPAASLVSFLN